MTEFPSYRTFYRVVNGREPFPWQERLARLVVESGWPGDIGVPTGLGKTSTIDVAIWALARQAFERGTAATLPRRIWYVVDRRLLVDTASDHAQHLAEALAQPEHEAVAAVATALGRLCATGRERPLHVSRLRGGAIPGDAPLGRPPDPAHPAIICATVAMYGSRLMFRGFGSSRSMWPLDAAHAGLDSLVLLDEAHLAVPLQRLVALLPECDANRTGVLRYSRRQTTTPGPTRLLPASRSYPLLVNLTATGSKGAFDLDDNDRANSVVRRRLDAKKPTRLVTMPRGSLAAVLAAELRAELTDRGTDVAAVVFTNTPATARAVAAVLRRKPDPVDAVVLTGQLRDPDAQGIRERLLDPHTGAASGTHPTRTEPLVVVATQTLEVGADLDFDVCVSEVAGARAIVQRWGRLNRLGERDDATGVLVYAEDAVSIYGAEPGHVWDRLHAARPEPLDLGPANIATLLGPPEDRPGRVGELLPTHLWEFAKTSLPPVGAAPPEVFFDELDGADRRVGVLWRSVLPAPGDELYPPPSDLETVDVPVGELRGLLTRHPQARRLTDDGATVAAVTAAELAPGQRIVLAANAGGYGPSGWDPEDVEVVTDLSPQVRGVLHLTSEAVRNFLGAPPPDEVEGTLRELVLDDEEGSDPELDKQAADRLRGYLAVDRSAPLHGALRFRIERIGDGLRPVLRWEWPRPSPQVRVDALDELSNAPLAGLHQHLVSVEELAQRIASALGLPADAVAAVTEAARMHDLGKADVRFQQWLGATGTEPIAKSAMAPSEWRRAAFAAGWPRGARHELLSAQLLDAYLLDGHALEAEADLVRHLVQSHHGHARPLCPTSKGGASVSTTVAVNGTSVSAQTNPQLSDWNQPGRFRTLCEQYGYWGLVLLEAVVRQADHRVSAATGLLELEVI